MGRSGYPEFGELVDPEEGVVAALVLVAVLIVDVVLLVALIVWPWLFAAVVAAVMRLGLAGVVNDRDVEEVVDAALGRGMPERFARWLRPRLGRGRGGRASAG